MAYCLKKPSFRRTDPIDIIISPFQRFFSHEASSGLVLVGCMVVALILANSGFAKHYFEVLELVFSVRLGDFFLIEKPLLLWINDGFMALFFLLVGLEIKREILVGELSDLKASLLPLAAALGGMAVPAGIYLCFTGATRQASGWGVPMATDIAFALGVLAMMGRHIPLGLQVFLAAVAIVDDIAAVVLIALFYTSHVAAAFLWMAVGMFGVLLILNVLGVRSPLPYMLLGFGLWYFMLKSGIHATLAGVLLAAAIPARVKSSPDEFIALAGKALNRFRAIARTPEESHVLRNPDQHAALLQINHVSRAAETPLQRIEHNLLGWVTFFIVPVFALANAGIAFETGLKDSLSHPVCMGVLFGLALGKPLGIVAASWLVVKTGFSRLPDQVTMRHVLGAGCLAGIGFTMALFIANLAFDEAVLLGKVKIGILTASMVSWLAGWLILTRCK